MKNRRVVITRLGGPEVLEEIEEPVPVPGPGQVRVRVLATGVAFADVLMRYGLYPKAPKLPFSPGYDVVGEVDALGEGVSQLAANEIVAALIMFGGYSQFVLVPAEELVPVPAGIDPAEAVSLILNYTTACQLLFRFGNLRSQAKVLIHGAAGGVGTAALELGRIRNLELYGTASKPKHVTVCRLGAKPIDYQNEDFVEAIRRMTGDGVDLVIDGVGGWNFLRSYRALRRGGKLMAYGMSSIISGGTGNKTAGALSFALLGLLRALPDGRSARWYNITTEKRRHPDWFREDLNMLFGLLAEGKIKPIISEKLPLRQARMANQLVEKAAVSGKVVLLCQD
ncbi:MAG TPA: medium chain dehydrogenase/reductase family protein [Terriglobales bacterium]|nr:medium chain dehydrogenase/reductase family protein [Terriglobales bacterium]